MDYKDKLNTWAWSTAYMKIHFYRNKKSKSLRDADRYRFPSHFDLNKVHAELSQSNFSTTSDSNHPSLYAFGSIAHEILTWKARGTNWAKCGKFPKFGDHNNLLVVMVLLMGCDCEERVEQRAMIDLLALDFLFTEGAVPCPGSFWVGSRWADQEWVDAHITAIRPTWAVGIRHLGLLNLNDSFRVALPQKPIPANMSTPTTFDSSRVNIHAGSKPTTQNVNTSVKSEADLDMEDHRSAKRNRSVVSAEKQAGSEDSAEGGITTTHTVKRARREGQEPERTTLAEVGEPPRVNRPLNWKKRLPANANAPTQASEVIPSHAGSASSSSPQHSGPVVSAPNPGASTPPGPNPLARASNLDHPNPAAGISQPASMEHTINTTCNRMAKLGQELAALANKVDSLANKVDNLPSKLDFDTLTTTLTREIITLTSRLKSRLDGQIEEVIVEADKPTMAMITDLRTRNAKLESEKRELLGIVEAQGTHFQGRLDAMGRVLEGLLGLDRGVIAAREMEELAKMKAPESGSHNDQA